MRITRPALLLRCTGAALLAAVGQAALQAVPPAAAGPVAAVPAAAADGDVPAAAGSGPLAAAGGERSWPVAPPGAGARPLVVRGFQPPAERWAAGHRGVDLAARPGAVVRAAAPGRVVFAGRIAGRGVLSVELADSGAPPLRITYEPVAATAAVGDRVTAGQPVAVLEAEGVHCPGGCLHWGLLRGAEYLDPLSLLPAEMRRRGHARLLPVLGVPPPPVTGPDGPRPTRPQSEPSKAAASPRRVVGGEGRGGAPSPGSGQP